MKSLQKLYYSISDVCTLVEEEQHILRYWEKEFSGLKPKKNRGGNRIYSEKDIQTIKTIKFYLRVQKLTIKEAKKEISKLTDSGSSEKTLFPAYETQRIHELSNQAITAEKTQNGFSKISRTDLFSLREILANTLQMLKNS